MFKVIFFTGADYRVPDEEEWLDDLEAKDRRKCLDASSDREIRDIKLNNFDLWLRNRKKTRIS